MPLNFLSVPVVVNIGGGGVDKHHPLVYVYHMPKEKVQVVNIRVRRGTRDRLDSVKNPGQTLDGIITQLIDLWEREKLEAAQPKKE